MRQLAKQTITYEMENIPSRQYFKVAEKAIIDEAMEILKKNVVRGNPMDSPIRTRQYLSMHFAGLEHEVFTVMYLDQRHRPIAIINEFKGTIDGASVYPREIVKAALAHNAAAVIFAHNHPSGVCEPSESDKRITKRLKDALTLVDIRTLDHFVIGGGKAVSFAERGLI